MKIIVLVKTNAKNNEVLKNDDENFIIKTTISPEKGKANLAVIKMLAKYFAVPKSQITILQGTKNKHKLIEIGQIKNPA